MATTTTAIWIDCSGGAFSTTSPALGSGAPWTTYSRRTSCSGHIALSFRYSSALKKSFQ